MTSLTSLRKDFLSPADEFSPAPFWFWNDELDLDKLKKQLYDFYDKGIRSFVIHPRKGLPLSTPYLSDSFLDYVESIVAEAQKLQMTVLLYDEAMYPSGSCNGQVVKTNPAFAAKGLQMHTWHHDQPVPSFGDGNWFVAATVTLQEKDGSAHTIGFDTFHAMNACVLQLSRHSQPYHASYFTLVYSQGTIRGVHPEEDDGEAKAPKATDLLDLEAVRTFLHLTHDVYYERLKDYFGITIIAMFTDEPSIMGRNHLPGLIPWTHGFLDIYLAKGGSLEALPLLFEQETAANRQAHQIYRQSINTLMAEHFFKPLSDWCTDHHIALAGHPAGSEDIGFLRYFQLPCQDIVWRYIDPDLKNGLTGGHSTMGKCSSDAARHSGKRRNGNECFGACGHSSDPWDFPFTDMKWYMNWLFARGVNLLIPHAFYYSLRDDRVNERPPDVGPNSPWWDHYQEIETYIRRMCWLNTDCVNVTDIAVLCSDDHLPWKPVKALYEHQIEFNYLETALLEQCIITDGTLQIARQTYHVLLVEEGLLISPAQQLVLEQFVQSGGTLLSVADFCDTQTLNTLLQCNPTALKLTKHPADLRISHVIKEHMHFYLMVNESHAPMTFEASTSLIGKKELWNPWDGTVSKLPDSETVSIRLDALEALILAVEA